MKEAPDDESGVSALKVDYASLNVANSHGNKLVTCVPWIETLSGARDEDEGC